LPIRAGAVPRRDSYAVLTLQRRIGNQAVVGLARSSPSMLQRGIFDDLRSGLKKAGSGVSGLLDGKGGARNAAEAAGAAAAATRSGKAKPHQMGQLDFAATVGGFFGTTILYQAGDEYPYTINDSRYKLGKALGEGTFGKVYILTPEKAGAPPFCVKVSWTEGVDIEQWQEMVDQVTKVGEHPNLATFAGVISNHALPDDLKGAHAYVLPAMMGGTMTRFMDNLKKAYDAKAVTYVEYVGVVQYVGRQLLAGIEHLARKGLIHKDIKPDNVMLDGEGNVKLIDVGTTKINEDKEEKAYGGYTPGWFPPDAYQAMLKSDWPKVRKLLNDKIDVFSAGKMCISMLSDIAPPPAPAPDRKAAALKMAGGRAGGSPLSVAAAALARLAPSGARRPLTTASSAFEASTMASTSAKRVTPSKAAAADFLSDPLLDDAGARAVILRLAKPAPAAPPAAGSVAPGALDGTAGTLPSASSPDRTRQLAAVGGARGRRGPGVDLVKKRIKLNAEIAAFDRSALGAKTS
jgi:serine/threonine protein kinase